MSTVTYSDIVQDIVTHLTSLLPAKHQRSVIVWPDRPDEYNEQKLGEKFPTGCYVVRYLKSTGSENGHETPIFGVVLVASTFTRISNMAATAKIALQDVPSPTGHKYIFAGVEPLEHVVGTLRDTVLFAVPRTRQNISDKKTAIADLNP